MPATTDTTRAEAHEMLAAVVRLCSRAADQSADSSRADVLALSLGAQLVASQILELLPADVQVDEPVPLQTDPLQLLRAAEALTRTRPIEDYPAGTAQVITAIWVLIREHAA